MKWIFKSFPKVLNGEGYFHFPYCNNLFIRMMADSYFALFYMLFLLSFCLSIRLDCILVHIHRSRGLFHYQSNSIHVETRAKHKKAAIVDKMQLIVFPENPTAHINHLCKECYSGIIHHFV